MNKETLKMLMRNYTPFKGSKTGILNLHIF